MKKKLPRRFHKISYLRETSYVKRFGEFVLAITGITLPTMEVILTVYSWIVVPIIEGGLGLALPTLTLAPVFLVSLLVAGLVTSALVLKDYHTEKEQFKLIDQNEQKLKELRQKKAKFIEKVQQTIDKNADVKVQTILNELNRLAKKDKKLQDAIELIDVSQINSINDLFLQMKKAQKPKVKSKFSKASSFFSNLLNYKFWLPFLSGIIGVTFGSISLITTIGGLVSVNIIAVIAASLSMPPIALGVLTIAAACLLGVGVFLLHRNIINKEEKRDAHIEKQAELIDRYKPQAKLLKALDCVLGKLAHKGLKNSENSLSQDKEVQLQQQYKPIFKLEKKSGTHRLNIQCEPAQPKPKTAAHFLAKSRNSLRKHTTEEVQAAYPHHASSQRYSVK